MALDSLKESFIYRLRGCFTLKDIFHACTSFRAHEEIRKHAENVLNVVFEINRQRRQRVNLKDKAALGGQDAIMNILYLDLDEANRKYALAGQDAEWLEREKARLISIYNARPQPVHMQFRPFFGARVSELGTAPIDLITGKYWIYLYNWKSQWAEESAGECGNEMQRGGSNNTGSKNEDIELMLQRFENEVETYKLEAANCESINRISTFCGL